MKNKETTSPAQNTEKEQDKDENDFIERSKYVYELVNKWIENADSKVGISCGIFSGVFAVIAFLTEQYVSERNVPVINGCWRCLYKGSFIVGLIAMAAAIFFYAKAILPNLKSNAAKEITKKYPIYYGDIASLKEDKYRDLMAKGTATEFNEELILETHFNSSICLKKMKNYRIGVCLSIVAVLFAFLSLGARFMMYH